MREALAWNFLSALTSVIGTMVALMASSYVHGAVAHVVSGLTVGGFLCVGVLSQWPAHTSHTGTWQSPY